MFSVLLDLGVYFTVMPLPVFHNHVNSVQLEIQLEIRQNELKSST